MQFLDFNEFSMEFRSYESSLDILHHKEALHRVQSFQHVCDDLYDNETTTFQPHQVPKEEYENSSKTH
jgi:hypothetical protein